MRLCPNSTFISALSPRTLQCRASPHVAVDFEEVALLVGKADFALLVEAGFLEVVCQPTLCQFLMFLDVGY
jgi:hypothetical protein